jgi:uncharacterized protein YggE
MTTQQALTNVSAVGVAEADYDVVRFCVTIEGKGKTGPAAKEDARKGIDATTAAIKALEDDGINVDRDRLKASLSVNAHQKYDRASGEHKKDGYLATYTVTFSSTSVDKASDIQDRLTSIADAQVAAPDFKILDLAGLQRKALIDAKAKVDQRFDDQCAVLGIRETDCSLASYDVRYDDSESAGARPMRALALMSASHESVGGGGPPPVEIKAGKARVKATLTVSYQRRTSSRKAAKKASPAASTNGGSKPAGTRAATAAG